jgi:hypothetical protein
MDSVVAASNPDFPSRVHRSCLNRDTFDLEWHGGMVNGWATKIADKTRPKPSQRVPISCSLSNWINEPTTCSPLAGKQ